MNAPLIDVILMLARQVKLNLIIDPQVLEHEFPTEDEPFGRRHNRTLFARAVHGLAALDSAAPAASAFSHCTSSKATSIPASASHSLNRWVQTYPHPSALAYM